MKKILEKLNIFGGKKEEEKNDFSEFFTNTKSSKKAKLIRRVLKEATEEQKNVIKRFSERHKYCNL